MLVSRELQGSTWTGQGTMVGTQGTLKRIHRCGALELIGATLACGVAYNSRGRLRRLVPAKQTHPLPLSPVYTTFLLSKNSVLQLACEKHLGTRIGPFRRSRVSVDRNSISISLVIGCKVLYTSDTVC